ncbi:MAG: DNA recombination protein RmuC [Alphaproteobacteria bacterium]|nr:DNA recombination protein RmuC [Alphaproteobacteria bacterium]
MTFTPDILSLLAGAAGGLVCGLLAGLAASRLLPSAAKAQLEFSENERAALSGRTAAQEEKLQAALQDKARLESELKNQAAALQEQVNIIAETKKQMSADFKAMSLEALNASRENFLSLAQERFTQMQAAAQANIKGTVDPLATTLKMMDEKVTLLEKERHGAYGELREHLKAMKTDQDKLRSETAGLVQALRSPSTRGQWGEMQLKRTLEMAGLVEGIHYDQQVSVDNQRPDVVVKLPGGKSIVIDAKAPIEAYLDSIKEGASEQEREAALDRHVRHVREHIKQLGSKAYWQKFDTPEFVIMFLPGESYFSAAIERDPGLLEAGVEQKVIPSSPTTLISLLKAVAYGWQQEKLAENAREISDLGRDLYKRLSVFGEHMQKIGKGLSSAMKSYNDGVGSLERNVLPKAREMHDHQTLSGDDGRLPVLDQLDQSPRQLTAPEFLRQDDDARDGEGEGEDGDAPAKEAKKA